MTKEFGSLWLVRELIMGCDTLVCIRDVDESSTGWRGADRGEWLAAAAFVEQFSIQDISSAAIFSVTKALSDGSSASDVLWEGSPWVTPGLVGVTLEAVALFVFLTWFELAVLNVGSLYLVAASYLVVGIIWVAAVARLELLKLSNHYALRESSLEIQHGIVGKRTVTVSAAGFSDLEVTKTLAGRVLNVGDIVVETDSDRDVGLTRVRDPIKVASMIGQVMTVPTVRVQPGSGDRPRPS